ncbi:Lrp/AsnC family transcriptional regulator [Rhodobacteraceae bacterium RKSG542]|uniref:Lrp/AsnC family transcriptional regulator n=1 Tax=Pseudovibrio flavus TaxID=2529854 RepID=UPI0012BD7065|nr:Lrp/AsnC family transcriptional regulator [Pseudovibrio flavus]MTI19210.1 Lrp/AsnC family transcriptional regulator [Pseudovibrio flavus]
MKFDRIDQKILAHLQNDARITNAHLSEKVGLSPSACLRRVKALEEAGVIDRYVALLNPQTVGRNMSVFVEISLGSQAEEVLTTFEEAVRKSNEIMECHLMGGDADYLLRIVAKDPNDFERIHRDHLTRLPGVVKMRSSFAIRSITSRTAFVLEDS